ncbi:hypothetical protein M0534_10910 [Methylonatrum kenyense]|uniref:hypothetical protein n=1 Tax=Methylonatrum kenyense TaxID=455253 RepID=UPI0020C18754|nr:hypothetical protein [Methylonatrum kenyense]MCK8516827.1 hypothetical protein [Methylonatrum kenyense]
MRWYNTSGSGSRARRAGQRWSAVLVVLLAFAGEALTASADLSLLDDAVRLSPLTLQRETVGVQMQTPDMGGERWRSRMLWLQGRAANDPLGMSGQFEGGAWQVRHDRYGSYAVNLAQLRPELMLSSDLPEQRVASMTGNRRFAMGDRQVTLGAEMAMLRQTDQGDNWRPHSGAGYGLDLQARELHRPLQYRLRAERFGRHFEPVTARRSPGQRYANRDGIQFDSRYGSAAELQLHAGYSWQRRYPLRGPVTAQAWHTGLRLPGNVLSRIPVRQDWRWRHQQRSNGSGTVASRSRELRWSGALSHPGPVAGSTRLQLRWYALDDQASGRLSRRSRQLQLDHSRQYRFAGMRLQAGPGFDYRVQHGFGAIERLDPTFRVNLSGRAHRLAARLGTHTMASHPSDSVISVYGLRLNYRYRLHTHMLGLAYDHALHDQRHDASMDLWRAGLYWRYGFRLGGDLNS